MDTTTHSPILDKFNLANLPPEGSKWAGKYFNKLWEEARKEKIGRLGLHQRFIDLHAQYRGKRRRRTYPRVGANHIFTVVETYCATLTEKVPISELTTDNADDQDIVQAFDHEKKDWWKDSGQQFLLYASTQNMTVYGTTIEKGIWNYEKNSFENVLLDVFNGFPCPGYKLCDMDLPYFCEVDFLEEWEIKSTFDLPDNLHIPQDADEQLAGTVRETTRGGKLDRVSGHHYPTNYADIQESEISESLKQKTMVVEIWVKDKSIRKDPIMAERPITDDLGRQFMDSQGNPATEQYDTGEVDEIQIYPDGVRKIVICPALMDDETTRGVLDDSINPCINWALLEMRVQQLIEDGVPVPAMDEAGQPIIDPNTGQPAIIAQEISEDDAREQIYSQAKVCFPFWGRFPYWAVPSKIDTSQWWGFSVIEQLEELQGKLELMFTKYLLAYERMMFPIFINPQGSGVEDSEISDEPGITLRPTIAAAALMGYIDTPQPPREYLEVIIYLAGQEEHVAMTPAVMRGDKPTGITAAAAVIALQDKASTLTSPQIRNVDSIVEWRGKAKIHFDMNFDTEKRQVMVNENPVMFRGIDLFTKFKFIVESGSSAPITKAGRRQLYVELYKLQALDLETLLSYLDIPQAKLIVERIMERDSVPGALEVLLKAGVPPELLQQIAAIAMQPQFEPKPSGGTTAEPAEKRAGGYSEGIDNARQGMAELREG